MKRFVATVLCASIAIGSPVLAFAQDAEEPAVDEFDESTRKAAEAYDRGDYDTAVELFKKAYELRQVSNILYNIGRIYEDAGDIDSAIEYYDKFVVAPNVEQTSRKDALERLTTLREVKRMQEGDTEVAETETEVTPAAPQPAPKSNTGRTVGWVFLGVGGASLVGSGVFALLTQAKFNEFEDATSLQDRRDASSAGKTNAVVSDALLVTGAVSAIVGAVFLIANSGSDTDTDTALRVSPLVGTHAFGLGLDLDF
jgi:tetratricopeptide (TPR) repeat protein